MASFASSSRTMRGWTYDVFLSFRGEDTRNNFVDHLYAALVQRGMCVFKDDKMLDRGKVISRELVDAIEESRFAVVVFSKNYANSSWCLEELAKIMECKDQKVVLPVFYHVDPSDVRCHKRDFALAFEQHEDRFKGEMDKIKKWKNVLTEAANLSGWHISALSGGEYTVINKIVQKIWGDIQPLGVEDNLIGIESRIDALSSLLRIQATEEVRMVGVYGMGGIGKTTIVRALFRRITYKFDGSSFVKDVKENGYSDRAICALQDKILKDILALPNLPNISDPDYGADMIRNRFCNKKVLLVLDDVDDVKQLEFLAATHDWFGPGSRIIITTRDEHLLSNTNANYKPAVLLEEQAIELFSRHAFRKNIPPKAYKELSNRAIQHTGYLPLALKVLGSFLRGREPCVWGSALDRLAKIPDRKIFETLVISFDGLNDSEKKIFLDIACFFKGKDVEDVTRVLDSFGFDPVIGIRVLTEKSLIMVSNKKLEMHDLIQEMGWQIVRERSPNSRLWKMEEIIDCVKIKKNIKAIEAIVMHDESRYWDDEKLGFSAGVFEHMKNLRLLDIHVNFTYREPIFLPKDLQWLCWTNCPSRSLPMGDMRKFGGLKMINGNIEHLWKEQKIMLNLKFIHIRYLEYLTTFLDVSAAPNYERLILSRCHKLVEIHESLGSLRRLVYLEISECRELKVLPKRIEMESLETLILFNCGLKKFPEVSPCMVKLSNLNLQGCEIQELPPSIRYLSNLSILNLKHCRSLKDIPYFICQLKNIKSLDLGCCKSLKDLPENFGSLEKLEELLLNSERYMYHMESFNFHNLENLCSLKKLDLSWRQIHDKDFPNMLHTIPFLEELHLSGNSKLTQLPTSISHMSRLKHLELNSCHQLQSLHSLPSGIQVLRAGHCRSLEKIEDLSEKYEWLYKITLVGCMKLLEDKDNQRYLNKMLQQSFIRRCAAADHHLSIAIPEISKIPRWFTIQDHWGFIAFKYPLKCYTQIMGFAICGEFHGRWFMEEATPSIRITLKNDGKMIHKSEPDYININESSGGFRTLWISYIPFSFQKMHQDWSHTIEGNLVANISYTYIHGAGQIGLHPVYTKDVESIQQTKPSISDYSNAQCVLHIGNTSTYTENYRGHHYKGRY